MKKFDIAVIPGDGIGPEVVSQAVRVLDAAAKKFDFSLDYKQYLAGGCAIDKAGTPLPQETIDGAKAADAVLLGAVGGAVTGSKWDQLGSDMRPENALMGLRKELGLFANLRPAILFKELADICPLKTDFMKNGIDILVVRELTGGIYFGKNYRDSLSAYDTMHYTKPEVERIVHTAFKAALIRKRNVVNVDKANILESSRLWREVAENVAKEYPQVSFTNMLVDRAAMELIKNPGQFDVVVTCNMFGDILSDEAAMMTGSLGMLPSASLGEGTLGLYEPVHGSAPDIAGQGIVNPIATILSAAMLLRYSLDQGDAASSIERAVKKTLSQGARTGDIAKKGEKKLSTLEITDIVITNI